MGRTAIWPRRPKPDLMCLALFAVSAIIWHDYLAVVFVGGALCTGGGSGACWSMAAVPGCLASKNVYDSVISLICCL